MHIRLPGLLTLIVLSCLVCPAGAASAAGSFETPSAPSASAILPSTMRSGPDFNVDPVVGTDGYLYVYDLHTRFGDLRVASTALLATRIAETAALARMEQVSARQEFRSGLINKGQQTVSGAVDLVTNPLGTLSGAATGVGRMFESLQQNLTSGNLGDGSGAANLLGVPALARQYARQFGVDPYTTNPLVQKRLQEMASAGAAGNITASALAALIPGGVGIAVSAAGASATLNTIDLTASPATIAQQNQAQLAAMGVSSDNASSFIGNSVFTPTQQSRVVAALAAMPSVQNKGAFVGFLGTTDDQDLALFRQRMAEMYAGYNANVAPLSGFMPIGRYVGAMSASGRLILAFPMDTFFWTRTNASIAGSINAFARNLPAAGVEVWITGKASPMVVKQLRGLGWTVHDKSAQRLLGQAY